MNASKTPPKPPLSHELDAALDWWREAGVDSDFADDATAWLSTPEHEAGSQTEDSSDSQPTSAAKSSAPTANSPHIAATQRVDFFAEARPQSLAEFRDFWLTAPGLDVIGPRGRVAPRGAGDAETMILVVDPEQNDSETLLSGPQGRLLERILKATGTPPETAYFASALPRHTPMADTAQSAAAGMDTVLDHHISLVSPKRLIAFGAGLAAFLEPNVSPQDNHLPIVNQSSRRPDTLLSEGLDSLMDMPRLKTRFWRRWIEWSARH